MSGIPPWYFKPNTKPNPTTTPIDEEYTKIKIPFIDWFLLHFLPEFKEYDVSPLIYAEKVYWINPKKLGKK